jgi:hypothetical protein
MAAARRQPDQEADIKELMLEVRQLRKELDFLKLGPGIEQAVKEAARKKGNQPQYNVTYSVYSKRYAVMV